MRLISLQKGPGTEQLDALPAVETLGEDFDAFVGSPRAKWFTTRTWKDPEFPGGAQARTRVKDGAFDANLGV